MVGVILGIDPGLDGALFWYWLNQAGSYQYDYAQMPTVVNKTGRRAVNNDRLSELVDAMPIAHAFYEEVHAMPRDGAAQAFAFGDGFGAIKQALASAHIPRTTIPPQTWKKFVLIPDKSPKEYAQRRAAELIPAASRIFFAERLVRTTKQCIGIADAALLAYYGYNRCLMLKQL